MKLARMLSSPWAALCCRPSSGLEYRPSRTREPSRNGLSTRSCLSYLAGGNQTPLNYGVLLTTGLCSEMARNALRHHNRNHLDRQVGLIDGEDLANLFLQHFPPETVLRGSV